jgi:hypothetical protein
VNNQLASEATQNLKVDRASFDAILSKLIASPPKPVTPKRKARKAPAKRKP